MPATGPDARRAAPRAPRRFGQHFLEPAWVDRLVRLIAPGPDETFIEIGPGRGALTLALARSGATVVAIEIDRDLAGQLAATAPPNVRIVTADVLAYDLDALVEDCRRTPRTTPEETPPPANRWLRAVGNLPYGISSPVIRALLRLHRVAGAWSDATLLVQREVGLRLTAGPGTRDYSVLGVLVQQHADVELLLTVPPGAFRPVPRVTSSVVRLRFRPPRVRVTDEIGFEGIVRAVFQQRRKTLANALKAIATARGATAAGVLDLAGVGPRRRPDTLTLEELGRLAEAVTAVALGA